MVQLEIRPYRPSDKGRLEQSTTPQEKQSCALQT